MADHALIPRCCHRRLKCIQRTGKVILMFLKCVQMHRLWNVCRCTLSEMCVDTPRLAQLRFGMFSASRILHMWEFSIRVVNYICMYKGVLSKSILQHTGTWSAAAWPPAPLPPPPTVSVIAQQYSATFVSLRFHSRMEKFDANFKNVTSFCLLFFLNYGVWNRVTWNCLMSWVSVSCSFHLNVRSAIDVEFIMHMKSCGNAKCSILEAWEDFCLQ